MQLARSLTRWALSAAALGSLALIGIRAADLEALATLHAASGSEGQARGYVLSRLGNTARVDNTGSVHIRFGSGAPHTLLVAGLDEPGYVVSGITEEGYLHLKRLAEPAPHYEFDSFFRAQPARVTMHGGGWLYGVAAAPSVHFDSDRGYRSGAADQLYFDAGASSESDARAAGIRVLDFVTREKEFQRLGPDRVTAPWISSRAGAAVLLQLAGGMKGKPPSQGAVTLAFVTHQYFYNQGLVRAIESAKPDRVVMLSYGGGPRAEIAPSPGGASQLAQTLVEQARAREFGIERGSGERLSFGPFGTDQVWEHPDQSAIITFGVENSGTPVEVVRPRRLAEVAALLAGLCGIELASLDELAAALAAPPAKRPAEPAAPAGMTPFVSLVRELTAIPGVSEGEAPVRQAISRLLPEWARERASEDEKGNLVVRLGRAGSPETVFIAHMDEIGFKVSRIASDGELQVESLGGGATDLFSWRPIVAHGAKGAVAGIMTRHGTVDAGAATADEAAALGIEVGMKLSVPKKFRPLLGRRATVRSFDDRVGCAALIAALRAMDPKSFRGLAGGPPVWIVFSVEEEVGLRGAGAIAEAHNVRRVYPIDSFVTSDSPVESKRFANARLGGGFVFRAIDNSGIAPREVVEQIARLAAANNIPFQFGVTAGGNDGSRFVRYGAVNIPLGWPMRYSHSPGEVIDLRDAEALEAIVRALIEQELGQGWPEISQ